MKQKRTFITLLLIIAILGLGIAYAAITGVELNITGKASATPTDENFVVKFSQEETDKPTTTVNTVSTKVEGKVEATITDNKNATISCSGLTTKDDYVTATYTVLNESPELTAYLTAEATCDNAAFTVTTDWEETSIAANGEKTITVTITLNETVADDVSGNVTVTLTAGSVQPTV